MVWNSRGFLALALGIAGAAASGCGTDATGVDACRKIEQARCSRAPACPTLAISAGRSVEECAQYARDRCLHGLPLAEPAPLAIDNCVEAIQSDSTCAVVAEPQRAPACGFLLASPPGQDASADSLVEAAGATIAPGDGGEEGG